MVTTLKFLGFLLIIWSFVSIILFGLYGLMLLPINLVLGLVSIAVSDILYSLQQK